MKAKRKRKTVVDADAQLMLIDRPPHPIEAEAREAKQCTAQLLATRRPEEYQEIIKALAANMPIREIKRLWGIGTGTVYAVLRREGTKVGTLKGQIAESLFHGVRQGAERFAELVGEADDVVAVAMATKAMGELGNLMAGQATTISEQRVVVVDANQAAQRLMREAREMGFGGGEKSALGAGEERDASPCLPADHKSAATEPQPLKQQDNDGSCHTLRHINRPIEAEVLNGGGGGLDANSCPPP